MAKMIQIRDVPEDLYGTLKARAAREGMNLSDFLKRELRRVAERPSLQEWLDRTQQAPTIRVSKTPTQLIRELRGSQ